MAKKKNRRKKGSLLPLLAIGVGIYLLTRENKVKQTEPYSPGPLPNYNPSAPVIQRLWPRRIPQTV